MNDGTFNTISLNSIDEPPDPVNSFIRQNHFIKTTYQSPIRTNFTGVPARTKISDGLNNSELKQHQQNEGSFYVFFEKISHLQMFFY
jgi:hypothetical protein